MPRTDRAARVIAAPLERVWAALIDPEALAAWLPPGEMTGRFERFEARPGGSYRMVLTYADASGAPGKATAGSDIVKARFVDIAPGERVVQAVNFVSDDPAYAGTMTMAWEIAAVEGGRGSRSWRRMFLTISRRRTMRLGLVRRWPISLPTWRGS
ncbi:MAG: SRPBCC domain-containing protein [Streptosporangiaceae bacterium]